VEVVVAAVAQAALARVVAAVAAGVRCLQLLARNFPLQPRLAGPNAVVVAVAAAAVVAAER
jgi:hypothetical protein